MERFRHGLILLAAIMQVLLTIIGFAFVDDADLVDGATAPIFGTREISFMW